MLLSVAKIEQPFLAIKPSITFSFGGLARITKDTSVELSQFEITIVRAS